MAQPLRMTRAAVVRLIRRWDDDIRPAAAAAGHTLPSPEFGDGMTRATARAMRQQGLAIPELMRALGDRGGFQEEAQAMLRLAAYFEVEHPQLADGSPAPWPASEPLSPAMAAFARGETNILDASALLPAEVEAMVSYARARNDPADFEGDRAATVQGEIEQLGVAAEKAGETTPMFGDNPSPAPGAGQERTMPDSPERAAALAKRDALWRDPEFQAAYHSPHIRIRRQAIEELNALTEIITGETGQAAGTRAATAPQSVIAPPVTAESVRSATPARRAPFDAAQLQKEAAGLTGAARAAFFEARFPGLAEAGAAANPSATPATGGETA